MDALQMLEDEHDDIQALLARIVKTEGTPARHLFDELQAALSLHEELEHAYVYPQLRQDEVVREIALEALEEHHLVDMLMAEIGVLKPKDEAWLPKIKLLRRIAQQHIEEEEHELFPRLRSIWDEDKSRHIARGMEELKARRRKELEVASPTG
jgi:hemerythrin superfamily protein